MPRTSKKLVLILATSLPITEASKEDEVVLKRIPCIYYPLYFRKNTAKVKTLLNSGSEVNTMTLIYTAKLGLKVRRINVGAQKIDGSTLKTFEIVLVSFKIEDKLEKARFFQETFLLADVSMEVMLGMHFLALSNADI